MELISWNAVLAANKFNPSILTQMWLIRNRIVAEEEFENPCVFTDAAVQVNTRQFSLAAVPEFFQFAPRPNLEREADLMLERVGRLVRALPQTPYTAIGLNFIWHLPPLPDIRTATRRLFFQPNSLLFSSFDVPDAQFGSYMSRDFHHLRLKLDIKPIAVVRTDSPDPSQQQSMIQFSFNFHKDLAEDGGVPGIERALELWDVCKHESERFVSLAQGD